MSIILITHIIAFCLSIVLTALSIGKSTFGQRVGARLGRLNLAVTAYGVTSGMVLIFSKPLGAHCALLFGYVVLFGLVSVFVSRRNDQLSAVAES